MEVFQQGKITRKLGFSFSFLILLFLCYGLYSLYEIRIMSGLTRTIYNHPLFVSTASLRSNVSITKIHRNMKDVVLFKDSGRVRKAIEDVNKEEQLVYQHLDVVKERILGDEGRELEAEARELFTQWKPIREEVIGLVMTDQRERAAQITVGKGAAHVAQLEAKMNGLTEYAREKASSFMDATDKTHARMNITSILFLIISIALSSLIAVFTLKNAGRAEKELRESRQLLSNAIDDAPIGMVLVETGGGFHRVNHAYCEMTGYSEAELSQMGYQDVTLPEDYHIGADVIQKLMSGEADKARFEKRYVTKKNEIIIVSMTTSLLRDHGGDPLYFFTQIQDITEKKKYEKQLEASLVEKEMLLKEVHHRVKNNMQMVQSILSLQADKVSEREYRQPLVESIHRIRIMSLVHENLYKSENISQLNLEHYFEELIQGIKRAFTLDESAIKLTVTIDTIPLDIDVVIVCGLIVNELVTNSIKYAFNPLESGKIWVTMKETKKSWIELVVGDNGKGVPNGFDIAASDSLGLRIVRILVEGQLEGRIQMDQSQGLCFNICFPNKT